MTNTFQDVVKMGFQWIIIYVQVSLTKSFENMWWFPMILNSVKIGSSSTVLLFSSLLVSSSSSPNTASKIFLGRPLGCLIWRFGCSTFLGLRLALLCHGIMIFQVGAMDFGRPLPLLCFTTTFSMSLSAESQSGQTTSDISSWTLLQKLQHLLEQSLHLCPVSNINARKEQQQYLLVDWLFGCLT